MNEGINTEVCLQCLRQNSELQLACPSHAYPNKEAKFWIKKLMCVCICVSVEDGGQPSCCSQCAYSITTVWSGVFWKKQNLRKAGDSMSMLDSVCLPALEKNTAMPFNLNCMRASTQSRVFCVQGRAVGIILLAFFLLIFMKITKYVCVCMWVYIRVVKVYVCVSVDERGQSICIS